MARFLISWQWSEQQNDIEIQIFWLIRIFENWEEIRKHVLCLNTFASVIKVKRPRNHSACPSSEVKQSFVLSIFSSERSLDSVGRSRQESLSSVEEDDYDTLDDIDSDKNIVRTKVRLISTLENTSFFFFYMFYTFFCKCFFFPRLVIFECLSICTQWQSVIILFSCYRNICVYLTWPAKTRGSSARNIKSTSGEDTV